MIRVIKIVNVKISFETWPKINACEIIINENSETCAREIEVRKLTLFLYPKNEHRNIVIIGFMIIVNARRTANGFMRFVIFPIDSSIPNETKNIVEKKSLNDVTLLIITRLYGRLAKVNPAKKAPIEIEKFR